MSYVVIIRGPLGIGKSTIAKKLAEILKAAYFSVDEILDKNGLDEVNEQLGCISEANFLKVNQIVLPQLKSILAKNTSIIIDGNFYHQNQLTNLLDNLPGKHFVFTLTASLDTCIQRDS